MCVLSLLFRSILLPLWGVCCCGITNSDGFLVVANAGIKEFPGRLCAVHGGVQISKQDGDFAPGVQKVGDLGHWHKVGQVRLPCGCRAPVDARVALLENLKEPPPAHQGVPSSQRIKQCGEVRGTYNNLNALCFFVLLFLLLLLLLAPPTNTTSKVEQTVCSTSGLVCSCRPRTMRSKRASGVFGGALRSSIGSVGMSATACPNRFQSNLPAISSRLVSPPLLMIKKQKQKKS